jgi:hypothetical protein
MTNLPWRKLWREQPPRRLTELPLAGRALLAECARHAADDGLLCSVADSGNQAALLGRLLTVHPREKKSFFRAVQRLLDYGDDGHPTALVIRDGFFYLTRFEECQANRRSRDWNANKQDSSGTEHGQKWDGSGTEQGQNRDRSGTAVAANPTESLNVANDLLPEVEVEEEVEVDSRGEPTKRTHQESGLSEPSGVSPTADLVGWLRESYATRWQARYPNKRPLPLDSHGADLAEAVQLAERERGDTSAALSHVLGAFFADDSQCVFTPGHLPRGLVINWDRYVSVFREQQTSRRIAEGDAKYERDRAHYDRLHEQKRQRRLCAPVKVANGNNGCRSH